MPRTDYTDLVELIEQMVDAKIEKALATEKHQSVTPRVATVSEVDGEGCIWVDVGGQLVPIAYNNADVEPGDLITYSVANGRAYLGGNYSAPATSRQYVDRGITQVNRIVGKVKDDADLAKIAAEEADKVAKATNQHFWHRATDPDSDGAGTGAFVTDEEQASFLEAIAAGTEPTDARPLHNLLMNVNGILLRAAKRVRAAFTPSGVSFFDGEGNEASNVTASFGKDGFQAGVTGESHMVGDYHSLQLIDQEGDGYFHVSDLRDRSGKASLRDFITEFPLTQRTFSLSHQVRPVDGASVASQDPDDYDIQVEVAIPSPVDPSSYINSVLDKSLYTMRLNDDHHDIIVSDSFTFVEDYLDVFYTTEDDTTKAFTFGYRAYGSTIGAMSASFGSVNYVEGSNSFGAGEDARAIGRASQAFGWGAYARGECAQAAGRVVFAYGNESHAEGYNSRAMSTAAHAEGFSTQAINSCAHSEGLYSVASGYASHAQNRGTKAGSEYQTALGRYNVEDANGDYAVIIGNGTSDSARSNALTVDWDGSVDAAGGATLGGDVEIKEASPEIKLTTPATADYPDGVSEYSSYIRAYDTNSPGYGHNLVMNGGGNTIIGSGESAGALYDLLAAGGLDSLSATSEALFLTADNAVNIYSNANTPANRQRMVFGTGGVLEVPNNVRIMDSTNWPNYYPNARAETTLGYFYGNHVRLRSKEAALDNEAKSRTANTDAVPVEVTDVDNRTFARMLARQMTNGAVRAAIEAMGHHSGANVWNNLGVEVRADGSLHYFCGSPANFRADMGITYANLGTVPVAHGGTGATTAAAARDKLGAAAAAWTTVKTTTNMTAVTFGDLATAGYSEVMVVMRHSTNYTGSIVLPIQQIDTTERELYLSGGASSASNNRRAACKLTRTKLTPVVVSIDGSSITSSITWYLYAR